MKKAEKVLQKIAYSILGLVLLFLAYSATHYTFLPIFRESDDGVVTVAPDSRMISLLFILGAIAGIYILYKIVFFKAKSKASKKRRVQIFLLLDLAVTGVFLALYVANSYIEPYWDQAMVLQDAASFLKGDYSDMANVYLHKFPQQLGLIFCEMFFLRIWNFYGIFQYLNVIFILLIILFSYLLCDEIFDDEYADFLTIVGVSLFFPLWVYVSFVYGDIPSIAGSLIIAYLIAKWNKSQKWYQLVIALLIASITILVRENILIFLIAAAISLILFFMKKKKTIALVFALLILLLPIITSKGVKVYFEAKSGIEIDNPIPAVSWIAMGMQGDPYEEIGVGYYNGYNEATWWYQGATTEAAKEYVSKELKERLSYFAQNPSYALSFFKYKIMEQWLEPSFDSFYMTITNTEEAGKWAQSFYEGDWPERLLDFGNRYMTIIYFMVLVYSIYAFKHQKEAAALLLPIAFVGGFIFSIMWEAKGRYTMPYFVYLIPFAATGASKLSEVIRRGLRNLLKKV